VQYLGSAASQSTVGQKLIDLYPSNIMNGAPHGRKIGFECLSPVARFSFLPVEGMRIAVFVRSKMLASLSKTCSHGCVIALHIGHSALA